MNELTNTMAAMMISTRPAWLLPWFCAAAILGACVAAALAVCFLGMLATTVTRNKKRGGSHAEVI